MRSLISRHAIVTAAFLLPVALLLAAGVDAKFHNAPA